VFGNGQDNPDGHFLEDLKRWAKVADINCGQCKSCLEKQKCEHVFLHKFRATFCTTLLQSGLDIRTVMKLMGHSDLESTMRYLRPATGVVMQEAVQKAFA